MKLFTIGDSLSQGVMSLASARTDLSFSTLIAEKLGLKIGQEYQIPEWPAGGLPANIEDIFRRLERIYGSDISGFEWLSVLPNINQVLDKAEDYYERGAGSATTPYPFLNPGKPYFDNIAVSGFTVADAWQVTPEICLEAIEAEAPTKGGDGFLAAPNAFFYRTALKVLNPNLDKRRMKFTQLRWLQHHVDNEGVENLLLWLGANNALGTVVRLDINQTPNDATRRPYELPHLERRASGWNLWHPDDFEAEYRELLDRTDKLMRKNSHKEWKVFVGTIPLVTIAPLAKGVGSTTDMGEDLGVYYKYYTYFPFEERFARETGLHLTQQDALLIDNSIRRFNQSIKQMVNDLNRIHGKERYYVVDIEDALRKMAYKRNNGRPTYDFPPFFEFVYPPVNTKYYHADVDGRLKQGGIVSLDGVHPTAIGQGLIAYEFLKVMSDSGVVADAELDWQKIFAGDTLYSRPISLMKEVYEHAQLAQFIVEFLPKVMPGALPF